MEDLIEIYQIAWKNTLYSSTLAWKIPWMEEPGRLQSMGSLRVRHDWATSLSFFTFMHWRRKWQPTPVFLPGESQERQSLVGCRLWSRTESDTTEATWQQQQQPDNRKLIFFSCALWTLIELITRKTWMKKKKTWINSKNKTNSIIWPQCFTMQ